MSFFSVFKKQGRAIVDVEKVPQEQLQDISKIIGHDDSVEDVSSIQSHDHSYGAEIVTESKRWYLGQNERLFKVLLLICLLFSFSLGGNILQYIMRPAPRYFAVTPDFRLLEMPSLSEPVVSDQSLLTWATGVVINSLSLDFLQWRAKLQSVRQDFDPKGFESFVRSLKDGGNLKKIEEERLNLACSITEAPVITSSGLNQGVMSWKIEMPLLISYQSSKGIVATQKVVAQVIVQRTETIKNPRGLVIRQVVLVKKG